jgi:hypothetical protein
VAGNAAEEGVVIKEVRAIIKEVKYFALGQ